MDIIKVYENIERNLEGFWSNFSPGSNTAISTILFDGDEIVIPKNPFVINVLGEVINSTAFEYKKGTSVKDAINNAGGYKQLAKKDSVYVIRANGLIEKANRNIFSKNILLEPGDSVIVPRKVVYNNPGLEVLQPITQILSDLAFSAAAIESLSSN